MEEKDYKDQLESAGLRHFNVNIKSLVPFVSAFCSWGSNMTKMTFGEMVPPH